jgi:hypothetical protein
MEKWNMNEEVEEKERKKICKVIEFHVRSTFDKKVT